MKFIKRFLFLGLMVLLGFIILGFLRGGAEYGSSVLVDAPVEKSWDIFTDPALMSQWLSGFKSSEHIGGPVNGVGAQYNFVFEENGKIFEAVETITAYEPNKVFAFDMDSDMFNNKTEVQFTEEDGKTRITSTGKSTGKGLWKPMISFMAVMMEKNDEVVYKKLKETIEAN